MRYIGRGGVVVALLWLALPPGVHGAAPNDEAVLVLGVRSMEGDDALARLVTESLTAAARGVARWDVQDRQVSLAQMMLVHGCDEPDARCMADVAESLQVDRLIYGTLQRTRAGPAHDFILVLRTYAALTARVEQTVRVDLPQGTAEALVRARATRWAGRLAGRPPTGLLRVSANVPGATVHVNDRQVGVTSDEAGQLETEMVAGSHRVEVRAEGYGTFRGEVTVGPDERTLLEVELEERPLALQSPPSTEPPGERVVYRSPLTWPTYTTLGVGAASAAVAIYAFVRVGNLRSDREVRQWNEEGTFREACASARARAQTEADAQPAVRRCDQEARLSPLRWVFLALGLAASGTGAYLLWRDLSRAGGDANGAATTRLRLDADVDRHGGHVRTTWRF